MKLTKYQHACLVLEKDHTSLIIDLGTFSRDFITPKHLTAIVITHEHPDHFDESRIAALLKAHPKATLIAHEEILARFPGATTIVAKAGEPFTVGPFTLQLTGGTHAAIDPSVQTPPNVGVIVDETLYYPGDSFVVPNAPIAALALPVSAPWLKVSETIAFLQAVNPQFAFPTHDAILSDDGKSIIDRMILTAAQAEHITYTRLDGKSVELTVQ